MDYIQKINELKRRKNVVILTHCYQPVELDEVSDFVGDSFYLSKKATTTNADIIVLREYILWHSQQNFLIRIRRFCFRI